FAGHVFKSTVTQVAVQSILASDGAVGDVDVRPAIAIEIDNRYPGTHRSNLGHNGRKLGIEGGRLMNKINAGGFRNLLQAESVAGPRGFRAQSRSRLSP